MLDYIDTLCYITTIMKGYFLENRVSVLMLFNLCMHIVCICVGVDVFIHVWVSIPL